MSGGFCLIKRRISFPESTGISTPNSILPSLSYQFCGFQTTIDFKGSCLHLVGTRYSPLGKGLSSCLIAHLPELGLLDRGKIAALVGVAPLNRDSGNYHGKRIIWGGRNRVRRALYMATMAATRYNPVIRPAYERFLDNGKAKKVAIIACMRKLLVILNAMMKSHCYWQAVRKEPIIVC